MVDFTQETGGKLFGFHPEKKSAEFPDYIMAVVGRFGRPISSRLTEVYIPGAHHLCAPKDFHRAELEKLPEDGQYRLMIKTTDAKTISATGFIS